MYRNKSFNKSSIYKAAHSAPSISQLGGENLITALKYRNNQYVDISLSGRAQMFGTNGEFRILKIIREIRCVIEIYIYIFSMWDSKIDLGIWRQMGKIQWVKGNQSRRNRYELLWSKVFQLAAKPECMFSCNWSARML